MIYFKRVSKDTESGRIGQDIDIFMIKPHIDFAKKFVLLARLPGIKNLLGTFDSAPQAKLKAMSTFQDWLERCDLEAV